MKRKTIHSPNYKDCGIGFTTTPTCVMENPHQWGLSPNGFRLWAYLISRIKKEQYFNGRTIKTQLKGTMGESAVSAALKDLCALGFCTKEVNHSKHRQFAGWTYTFYAIPKNRDHVHQINPDVCEKLAANGWFDRPDDGNPSSGGLPDDGNPTHGEAPLKERDETEEKEENKEKTPNPLSGKEGSSQVLSGESDVENTDLESSALTSDDEVTGAATGMHSTALSKSLLGSRLLKMFRPAQVPDDKALRPLSRMVQKGEITDAYATFLWERVIHPNQLSVDADGALLKSLPEILEVIGGEGMSPTSDSFKKWRADRLESLNQLWTKGRENLPLEEFHRRASERASSGPFDGIDITPGELKPDSDCTPFRLFIYLHRCKFPDAICYSEQTLLDALYDGRIWEHLLDQAGGSHEQFYSLRSLVNELKDKIPSNRSADVAELHTNYIARNTVKMQQLMAGFADMGCAPPQNETAG